MSCPIYKLYGDIGTFQPEYSNGGNPLLLKTIPTTTMEQADAYMLNDLNGYMLRKTRITTSISLLTIGGEEVTLSGDVATILNILEKLK